jgi:hypothetical protein
VGLDYDVSAKGIISSDNSVEFPLQRTALSMYEFRHPGIGHFRPWFNADVGVTADVEMEGNFTISYQAATAGTINQGYPTSGLGSPSGYGVMNPKGTPFNGAIKSASAGGLKIRTTTQTGLEIVFNKYGNSGEFLGVNVTGTTDTYAAVQVADNKYTVSVGSDKASSGLVYASGGTETIAAWDPDSSTTVLLGDRLGAKQVASGSPDDDKDPSKGPSPHYIEYDGDAVLAEMKNVLACPTGEKEEPSCNIFLCTRGDVDCSDDDDGPYSTTPGKLSKKRKLKRSKPALERMKRKFNSTMHGAQSLTDEGFAPLERRLYGERTLKVPNPDTGNDKSITYKDEGFPSMGEWEKYGDEGVEQIQSCYAFEDYDDCANSEIVALSFDPDEEIPEGTRSFASRFGSHHHLLCF